MLRVACLYVQVIEHAESELLGALGGGGERWGVGGGVGGRVHLAPVSTPVALSLSFPFTEESALPYSSLPLTLQIGRAHV